MSSEMSSGRSASAGRRRSLCPGLAPPTPLRTDSKGLPVIMLGDLFDIFEERIDQSNRLRTHQSLVQLARDAGVVPTRLLRRCAEALEDVGARVAQVVQDRPGVVQL